jgi:Tfp pilus assembly protein PilV
MNETQDAGSEAGFSLVETMVASLVLTIGLVGLAQLLAVATIMHSDARQATTGTVLAQAKLDELMKVDFSLNSTVALGGSVASNMAPYFDQPSTTIDRRWRVTDGPVAGTRLIQVTVENKGGRLYGRSQTLTTVIRDW